MPVWSPVSWPLLTKVDIEGEKLRWNLQDGEQGVLMYLDFQIIDTETCKPVEGQYVEIWRK